MSTVLILLGLIEHKSAQKHFYARKIKVMLLVVNIFESCVTKVRFLYMARVRIRNRLSFFFPSNMEINCPILERAAIVAQRSCFICGEKLFFDMYPKVLDRIFWVTQNKLFKKSFSLLHLENRCLSFFAE